MAKELKDNSIHHLCIAWKYYLIPFRGWDILRKLTDVLSGEGCFSVNCSVVGKQKYHRAVHRTHSFAI